MIDYARSQFYYDKTDVNYSHNYFMKFRKYE